MGVTAERRFLSVGNLRLRQRASYNSLNAKRSGSHNRIHAGMGVRARMDQQRRYDSLYASDDANANSGVSQQTFDYIDALMQRARKGRVIERTTRVEFVPPDAAEWRERALGELPAYQDKRLWAEVYIRCGRCKREWDAWLAENLVTEPLSDWTAKAAAVVTEKRWI